MMLPDGVKTAMETKKGAYKRPFDLFLIFLAHGLFLPIWLAIWTLVPVAIWLEDRGPVFYKQLRTGRNGQVFVVRKFRTMVPDADFKGPAWTVQGDPRLTRVGKVLRRTALDEVPELWSILKGDMGFVGPRPLQESEQSLLEKQIPGFRSRLMIRPGLTGMAQVYDLTDNAIDKFKFDLEYLERLGLCLDIKLIILSVLNSLGARWDHRTGKPQGADNVPSDSDGK